MSRRSIEVMSQTAPENETREIQLSQNLEYSAELLKNPPRADWPGHDRFFITGHVKFENGVWQVEIGAGDPTAAIDQFANEEFGTSSPLVSDLRRDNKSGLSLISAGSFVWFRQNQESKLVLLKRSEDAKADPGCLTGPAGRCGEKPSETIEAETREELTIAQEVLPSGKSHYSLMVFYQNEGRLDLAIDEKMRQLAKRQADLKDRYEKARRRHAGQEEQLIKTLEILRQIRSVEDITPVNLADCPKNDGASDKVITRVGAETVDEIKNCLAFFDKDNNTLEIRKAFEYTLPENKRIALIIDGENFNREVEEFGSTQELLGRKDLVPALKNYAAKNQSLQN